MSLPFLVFCRRLICLCLRHCACHCLLSCHCQCLFRLCIFHFFCLPIMSFSCSWTIFSVLVWSLLYTIHVFAILIAFDDIFVIEAIKAISFQNKCSFCVSQMNNVCRNGDGMLSKMEVLESQGIFVASQVRLTSKYQKYYKALESIMKYQKVKEYLWRAR